MPLEDDHLKYLWAAYRRGAFERFIPDNLKQEGFRTAVLEFVGSVIHKGGEVFTFMAKKPFGEIPVGMVVVGINGTIAEPHAFWFPEATPRNRLELSLAFLIELKKNFKFHLWVRAGKDPAHPSPDWKHYSHLCKYGVIRTVGKRRNLYPDGEDGFLFQDVRA